MLILEVLDKEVCLYRKVSEAKSISDSSPEASHIILFSRTLVRLLSCLPYLIFQRKLCMVLEICLWLARNRRRAFSIHLLDATRTHRRTKP
jgi:hypothetical protein